MPGDEKNHQAPNPARSAQQDAAMVILAVLLCVIVLVIASVIAIRQARAQGLNVWTITVIGQDAELGTVTLRLEDLEALVRASTGAARASRSSTRSRGAHEPRHQPSRDPLLRQPQRPGDHAADIDRWHHERGFPRPWAFRDLLNL